MSSSFKLWEHSICWYIWVLHCSVVTWLYPCCATTKRLNDDNENQNSIPNPSPCRCRRHPLRRSKCEASRRHRRQIRAPQWPSCSAPTTCARRPTTCRSLTWTCTSATTFTPRTKARDAHHSSWLQAAAFDIVLRFLMFLFAVINKRITGGAMQLSFSSITLDYYPFHRAGLLCNSCEIGKTMILHLSNFSIQFSHFSLVIYCY